jgi:hypothetical protein
MTISNDPAYPASAEATGGIDTRAGTTGETSAGPSSTDDTREQARHAAQTAADETKHVAAVAQQEVGNVAAEAKDHAVTLVNDAKAQLEEHSRGQRDSLVQTLRTFSDDLDQMATQGGGMAADLVRQAADRARSLGSKLDGREPAELLDDVRDFARRRPGTFLLGALAAGVVVGRLARGAKDANGSAAHASGSTRGLAMGPVPAQGRRVGDGDTRAAAASAVGLSASGQTAMTGDQPQGSGGLAP